MARKRFVGLLVMLFCLSWGFSMTAMARDQSRIPENSGKAAQDPSKNWYRNGPYRLLDTPEIIEEMEYARELTEGDFYFLITQRLQSNDIDDTYTVVTSPGSNNSKGGTANNREVPAVPTQVFDNVYYVGGMEVGGWLIDTGDGYIMLDSSYDYGTEEILLPNMEALGLDPAQVKYIMITHGSGPGGGDHAGAVKYFSENYGTKIVISQAEWDMTLEKLAADGLDPDSWVPEEDVFIGTDGKTLTVGDTTITMVHTPRTVGGGGLSYFIPVKIDGKRHLWATYGNTNVTGGIADKEVYLESMAKWLGYMDELKPDIAISSHPFVDGSLDRMEIIRQCQKPRNFRDPICRTNPFVIGKKGARRYMEILEQCALVVKMREEAGIDKNGVECLKGYEVDPNTGLCTELPQP